jgi:Ca-activated chloride channel family protein
MRFTDPTWLLGLWALIALGTLVAFGIGARRRGLRRFVDAPLLADMAPGWSVARLVVKGAFATLTIGLVLVSLARPSWGTHEEETVRKGRDVCFLIDVSRSMLAEDIAPNRLERAKLWVRDVLRVAEGDRVAIVAFAGDAAIVCPLTHDYGFARTALDELDTDSAGRGGTLIGDAIRTSMQEVFGIDPDSNTAPEARFRDIILITDGEDHESYPVEAAAAAGAAGVRILAVGIGREGEGEPIPVPVSRGGRTYLEYQGEQVRSSLDGETLAKMATGSAGGRYYHVSTGTIALDEVYRVMVRESEQHESDAKLSTAGAERFQIFLGLALIFVFAESFVRERKGVRS